MMRHKHHRGCWIGLILCLSSLAAAGPAQVRLSTHDLPPYSLEQGGQADGIAVRVVSCAMQRLGVGVKYTFLPWARAQAAARLGEVDGFFAASQSAERDSWATISSVIAPQQWRWYMLRDKGLDPRAPEFRQQAKVASFLGGNMLSWLKQEGYQLEAAPPRNEQVLQMLLRGRVDAILANQLVMDRLLIEQGIGDQVYSVLQQDRPLGVYFSHRFTSRYPDFLKRFNQAVSACLSP